MAMGKGTKLALAGLGLWWFMQQQKKAPAEAARAAPERGYQSSVQRKAQRTQVPRGGETTTSKWGAIGELGKFGMKTIKDLAETWSGPKEKPTTLTQEEIKGTGLELKEY